MCGLPGFTRIQGVRDYLANNCSECASSFYPRVCISQYESVVIQFSWQSPVLGRRGVRGRLAHSVGCCCVRRRMVGAWDSTWPGVPCRTQGNWRVRFRRARRRYSVWLRPHRQKRHHGRDDRGREFPRVVPLDRQCVRGCARGPAVALAAGPKGDLVHSGVCCRPARRADLRAFSCGFTGGRPFVINSVQFRAVWWACACRGQQ